MKGLPTKFAPAELASQKKIKLQVNLLKKTPLLSQLFNSINETVLILNGERQIVFANNNFLTLLKVKSSENVYGKRPGDIVGCAHASEGNGCGTTESCRVCGAVKAILESQRGKKDTRECRIINKKIGGALDLLVKTTPLLLHKQNFTIFTIKDTGDEKRRKALERIFFHDVLNNATCLKVASGLLTKNTNSPGKIKEMISHGVEELINNINSQRMLSAAENNELKITPVNLSSEEIIRELLEVYKNFAKEKFIRLSMDKKITRVTFVSDKTVLLRVLGNMVKNAIEACPPKKQVIIGGKTDDSRIHFWVHNPTFIPRKTQLQIFQRSFSTKEDGRGLGTYSMKLLSERYLKGNVTFTSNIQTGTTFTASYPLTIL